MSTLGIVKIDSDFRKVERKEFVCCSVHGLHNNWRLLYKTKNIKCRYCEASRQKEDRIKNPIKYLLKDAKQHAKQKQREFNLCEQDILNQLEKQNHKCAISGLSFSCYKMSLDRINNEEGYIPDNIQLVTIKVNRMKSDLEIKDFIDICKHIAKFNEEK